MMNVVLQHFMLMVINTALTMFNGFTCSNDAKSKATLLIKVLACDGHSSSIRKSTADSCLKESTRLLEGNYTNPLANYSYLLKCDYKGMHGVFFI